MFFEFFKTLTCGVGGVRTLVQTTNFQAFYMLISWLIFDRSTDRNTQNFDLATSFLRKGSTIVSASSMGWTSIFRGQWAGLRRKYLSWLLYFAGIKPINIQLIKQQVRMTYCQLLFETWDLRGTPQPSACWHLTIAIAVKSNVDPNRVQRYAFTVGLSRGTKDTSRLCKLRRI